MTVTNDMTTDPDRPTIEPYEGDAYRQFDLWDEEQILDELQGIPLAKREKWAYSFPMDSTTVTGISWAGIKEARNRLAAQGITIFVTLVGQVEDAGASYQAVTQATSDKLGSVIGGAEQSKTAKVRVGNDNPPRYEQRPDDKAYPKAISKAQRNALVNIIPTEIIDEIVRLGLEAKRAPRGQSTAASTQPQAKSKRSGVSDYQRTQMRDRYAALYGCDPDTATTGLDAMFVQQFGHGLDEATYNEGAHITAKLMNLERQAQDRQPQDKPQAPSTTVRYDLEGDVPTEYRNAPKLVSQLNTVFEREGVPFQYKNHFHLAEALGLKSFKAAQDAAFWNDTYRRALAHGREKQQAAA